MHWVDRLERRFGRYAIPNLTAVLLACQAAVWAVTWFVNANIYQMLTLTRSGVFDGQIWRLLTFLAVPTDFSVMGFLLTAYLYWFIGTALEQHWGDFQYMLYLLLGTVGCIAAALLTGSCGNTYLYASLFLAFAVRFPDVQLLLFFILPIRVKWLGIADGVLLLLAFVGGSGAEKLRILLSLLGFAVFFGPELWRRCAAWVRRERWRRQNRNNWR